MKTFAISLARTTERRAYIVKHLAERGLDFEIVEGVDGRLLSEADLDAFCDPTLWSKRWFTWGVAGCLLSHRKALRRVVDQGLAAAVIVEDDISLPPNVVGLLSELESVARSDEVTLLYYTPRMPLRISTFGKKDLSTTSIMFPYDELGKVGSAAAYVVGRDAAKVMLGATEKMTFSMDDWPRFRRAGVATIRVSYPRICEVIPFRTTLDYNPPATVVGQLSAFVEAWRIPGAFGLLRWHRRRLRLPKAGDFILTDERSPLAAGRDGLTQVSAGD